MVVIRGNKFCPAYFVSTRSGGFCIMDAGRFDLTIPVGGVQERAGFGTSDFGVGVHNDAFCEKRLGEMTWSGFALAHQFGGRCWGRIAAFDWGIYARQKTLGMVVQPGQSGCLRHSICVVAAQAGAGAWGKFGLLDPAPTRRRLSKNTNGPCQIPRPRVGFNMKVMRWNPDGPQRILPASRLIPQPTLDGTACSVGELRGRRGIHDQCAVNNPTPTPDNVGGDAPQKGVGIQNAYRTSMEGQRSGTVHGEARALNRSARLGAIWLLNNLDGARGGPSWASCRSSTTSSACHDNLPIGPWPVGRHRSTDGAMQLVPATCQWSVACLAVPVSPDARSAVSPLFGIASSLLYDSDARPLRMLQLRQLCFLSPPPAACAIASEDA